MDNDVVRDRDRFALRLPLAGSASDSSVAVASPSDWLPSSCSESFRQIKSPNLEAPSRINVSRRAPLNSPLAPDSSLLRLGPALYVSVGCRGNRFLGGLLDPRLSGVSEIGWGDSVMMPLRSIGGPRSPSRVSEGSLPRSLLLSRKMLFTLWKGLRVGDPARLGSAERSEPIVGMNGL